jgi:hypothetical protein
MRVLFRGLVAEGSGILEEQLENRSKPLFARTFVVSE